MLEAVRHRIRRDFYEIYIDRAWLKRSYYKETLEWAYKHIEPRIIVAVVGLADIAELVCQFEHANLGADDFLILGLSGVLWKSHGGGCATPTSSAPAMAQFELRKTPSVRLS
jgi:hypothetical protein